MIVLSTWICGESRMWAKQQLKGSSDEPLEVRSQGVSMKPAFWVQLGLVALLAGIVSLIGGYPMHWGYWVAFGVVLARATWALIFWK